MTYDDLLQVTITDFKMTYDDLLQVTITDL